jgi:hypothetical protein
MLEDVIGLGVNKEVPECYSPYTDHFTNKSRTWAIGGHMGIGYKLQGVLCSKSALRVRMELLGVLGSISFR